MPTFLLMPDTNASDVFCSNSNVPMNDINVQLFTQGIIQ